MKDAYFIASTDLYDDTFEDTLNIKHHLLPIKNNKIIDLSTGIQRGRTRDDLFSFECPVEYMENANFENVDKYMATTFCENQELVDYMQERMGVFLTGETLREIDVWYGCGRNGKTTTSEILRQIMGKFFCTINKAVFIEDPKSHQAKGAAHTSHLIPMIGKRLGMSSEVKAGDEFNTTMLKGLSGGDPITYREAYSKDEKTFVSYMKGVLMTNPKPVFDFEDKALIDRLRYVHFNARFVDEPDPDKPNEYLASNDFIEMMKTTELDNFFSYLVQGAVRFYARGKKLITPSIVMAAKVAGLRESDRVGRFIEEHCVVDSAKSIKASLIQNKFEQYLQDDGETPSKRGELSKGLESLGFVKWKSHGIMKFKGLTVEGYDDSDD
jgi:P4 family phage/plasmid primase-like protien